MSRILSKITELHALRTSATVWYIVALALIVLAPIRGSIMDLLCGLMILANAMLFDVYRKIIEYYQMVESELTEALRERDDERKHHARLYFTRRPGMGMTVRIDNTTFGWASCPREYAALRWGHEWVDEHWPEETL